MRGGRPSGVVAVLFTDLVGSTRLMSTLGDVAFDALRREHFSIIRKHVERSGGEVVKNTGDGVMATFGSGWSPGGSGRWTLTGGASGSWASPKG